MEQQLYKLPDEWEWVEVIDLASVKGGKRLPKGKKLQDHPTDYPYIRVTDFTDLGGINTNGLKYLTKEVHDEIKRYTISCDDLYISIAGTIGKTGIIPKELNGANLTENAAKLVFSVKQRQNLHFIYYFTLSANFISQSGIATKTVAQPKLALTRLGKIKIPLPPLNEQKRIVAKLDALFTRVDTAISHLQGTLALSKALFESALDEAFKPTSNQEQLPEGWNCYNFKDVCQLKRGYDLPKKSRVEGKFPLYSANGATDHIDRFKIKGPGVVTGRSGTIGKVHFVDNDYWPLNTALYVQDFKGNDERFIHYFLVVFDLTRFSSGAAVPTLNRNSLSSEVICIPGSIKEQKHIVAHLDALAERTRTLEASTKEKLSDLTALKASLLDAAFKGHL